MIIKLYFVCAPRTHMYGVQMKAEIESVKQAALAAIDAADSVQQLGEVRVRFLGKSGELTSLMKGLGALSKEERPEMGKVLNMKSARNRRASVRKRWTSLFPASVPRAARCIPSRR